MKILVIFTGGTIGSVASDGWISPNGQTKRELISRYEKLNGNDVEFVSISPYTILSENLSASEINLLVKSVLDNVNSGYDGIIVTHGTDTIHYSACALSYALGSDCIPVMLVSSNYPLSNPLANGHDNFSASVEFIKQKGGRGVFVAYRNGNSPTKFHNALSLICHREADDFLFSYNGYDYGELTNGKITLFDFALPVACGLGKFTLCANPNILVVNAYPGESYDYTLDNRNAVILRPYHSGTLNTASDCFKHFCNRASELNVPVFVVNATFGETYASSKEFSALNLIPVYSSTFASVYMRLWIAISRGENLYDIF